MNTLGKVGLSSVWWLTAMIAAAAAIEMAFGRQRPGFVPLATLPLGVPVLLAIWKRPVTQTVRSCAWTAGGIVTTIAIVAFSSINWHSDARVSEAHDAPEPPRSEAAQVLPPIPTNDGYPYGSYACIMQLSANGERPVLTVHPQELRREYAENQLASVEKYECRAVQTTGRVEEIRRDPHGAAYLSLSYGSADEIVFAAFDRENELPLRDLKRGQNVKVRCVVDPDSEFSGVRFHHSLHLTGCVILDGDRLDNGARRHD